MCTYGVGLGCVHVYWLVMMKDQTRNWFQTNLLACDSFALQSSGRCEKCLCRIRPMRSSLKHFCMALIRPGDIMQIPANVPRIRDEHRSLPPSPDPTDTMMGKLQSKSNVRSTWTFRSFTQRAREQDNLKQRLMEFQGPSERWLCVHVFCTSHLIAFIAVSMETAEHFEALQISLQPSGERNWCHATEVNKL